VATQIWDILTMNWIGIDIGGANIKVADGKGFAASHVFSLWKHPETLAQELRRLLAGSPPADHVVATMTGELADCFETKAQGVQSIVGALIDAVDNRHTRVYLTNGSFVTPQVAIRKPELAAASNWHALASYVARFAPQGSGLLIDIGSTTTDLIPLRDGAVVAQGTTDTERMIHGELFYSGVQRNPVCAIAHEVPYRDHVCSVAQEYFATTGDVYVILGDLAENPLDTHTADGRPATKANCRNRLARVICADSSIFNHRDAVTLAHAISEQQIRQIQAHIAAVVTRLGQPPSTIICSGLGEFLAKRLVKRMESNAELISLTAKLGVAASLSAPAHAVAVLAREAHAR
jgi:probable H4MPT-linked C1 transfer pathway protein